MTSSLYKLMIQKKDNENKDQGGFLKWKFKNLLNNLACYKDSGDLSTPKNAQNQQNLIDEVTNRIGKINLMKEQRQKDQLAMRLKFFEINKRPVMKIQAFFKGRKTRQMIKTLIKKNTHRKQVLMEFIKTEEMYVADLIFIKEYIYEPLIEIVSRENLKTIFANMLAILELNKAFLEKLKESLKSDPYHHVAFVQTLNHHALFFKMYFDYCNNYKKASVRLPELIKNDKKLQSFVAELNKNQKSRALGIEGFLVKPIQRLPKYVLLLNDYLKNCEDDRVQYNLFTKAKQLFEEVCDKNNENMEKFMQNIKIQEIQRLYGEQLKVNLVNKKTMFICEERLVVLIDGMQMDGQIYCLTEIVIICLKDQKTQFDYKLHTVVYLNEKSYCYGINRSQLQNGLRVVGKNTTVTFILENQAVRSTLQKQIESCMQVENARQIDVYVLGTEEREINTFSQYTAYIVDVNIQEATYRTFVRYSLVLNIETQISGKFGLSLPKFEKKYWGNSREEKIIQVRKWQIEHFIQTVLSSWEFEESGLRESVLEQLGLPRSFYSGAQSGIIESEHEMKMKFMRHTTRLHSTLEVTSEKMGAVCPRSPNLRSSQQLFTTPSSERIQLNENSERIEVNIIFRDGCVLPLTIPKEYLAIDLINHIANKIQLSDCYDFKLYETYLEKPDKLLRPLDSSEQISRIILFNDKVSFFSKSNKKGLLFQKYLYFPQWYDDILNFSGNSRTRQRLAIYQVFQEIQREQMTFSLKEYCILNALYMLSTQQALKDKQEIPYQSIENVVPKKMLKKQAKRDWVTISTQVYYQLYNDINQLTMINQDGSLQQELADAKHNRQLVAIAALMHTVHSNQLYGVTCYSLQSGKMNLTQLQELMEKHKQTKLSNTPIQLGISYTGIHIVDENRKQILCTWFWNEVLEMQASSDKFSVDFNGYSIEFFNQSSHEIDKLAQEYRYISKELSIQSQS